MLPTSNCQQATPADTSAWPFFLALAAVWGWLFFVLSGEWEANEQYSHGWFIPLLAGWIFWQRWAERPEGRPATGWLRAGCYAVLLLIAVPSAFGVLVAGAYPDWRLLLWGMAAAAVVASVALTALAGGWPWVRHLSFAYVFALVAVPWPTGPERWLTRELSLLAAKIATWCLPMMGVAAVCHGTSIDVGSDVLAVDDACSGIRSFQSSIMAALFLGELYALRWGYRLVLIPAGLLAAYALNILRMILLSVAVAGGGAGALGKLHDPAGFAILVLTMGALWVLCVVAQKIPGAVQPAGRNERGASPAAGIGRAPAMACLAVIGALGLMVAGAEGWYVYKSRDVARAPAWTIAPAGDSGASDEPLDARAEEMLKYDLGFQRAWHDGDGRQWHLIYLDWKPSRMSLHYAQPHLPEQCQTMIGRTILSKSELRRADANGISIPYYLYKIRSGAGEFFLMYVVNDDRIGGQQMEAGFTAGHRINAVLAGRRNMGQRSMQLALVGESDEANAEEAMREMLPQLVKPVAR